MAASIAEHFRNASNAYDFGECNYLLFQFDVTEDDKPEVFLSHREFRVGGVHTWHVYTPLADDQTRFLGSVNVHPRGLRRDPGQPGFFTFAGETYDEWRIDGRGLHQLGSIPSAEARELDAIPVWIQQCADDGEQTWLGFDDEILANPTLDAIVISGAEQLAAAATEGDLHTMDELLGTWVEMYGADNAGGVALRAASTIGNVEAIRYLLDQSDDHPDAALRQGLLAAAWEGHLPALEVFLAADLGASRADLIQEALSSSSQSGKVSVLETLLAAGADPHVPRTSWEPFTPVEFAADRGHTEYIQALDDQGIDVSRAREIYLLKAIDAGDELEVRRLIESGVSPDIVHPGGTDAPALIWAMYARRPNIAMTLLELGAGISGTDNRQETPLIKAAGRGYLELVDALLDRGANAGAVDRLGTDALTMAASSGHFEVVDALLDRARKQLPADALNSALVYSASGGHSEIICLLLSQGADQTWTNALERTARDEAEIRHKVEIVYLLDDWQNQCTASGFSVNGFRDPR